jgi:hypothetical protein
MDTIAQTLIPHHTWKIRADQYSQMVKSWTEPYRQRKGEGTKHPVYDFLFSYYSYPMAKLETWHPGFGVLLEAAPEHHFNSQYYREINGTIFIDPTMIPEHRTPSLRWIQSLLEVIQNRTASFSCFGLHEWAMVYQVAKVRHQEHAPLRLSQKETNTVVESRNIRCSHYDAYRFFSEPAQGFNKLNPEKENRLDYEQPGCLHTNMDLYKWCYKAMPWMPSELLWRCFILAKDIRELDMRASPYDLTEYNLSPVKIETKEGRDEYEHLQRALSARAAPIRKDLIEELDKILNVAEGKF